jgi:hypothetical protein
MIETPFSFDVGGRRWVIMKSDPGACQVTEERPPS